MGWRDFTDPGTKQVSSIPRHQMMQPVNYDDYRELARWRLPRVLFDYIDGGAGDETTLRNSRTAIQSLQLRQRVMRDVAQIDLATELFGEKLAMPVVLGPVGMAGMFARRGETSTHQAAAEAGITSCLSTLSVCSVEEVSQSASRPPWFQLYMIKDRGYMQELLQRVKAVGCPVLVLTVDVPVAGIRNRDLRAGRAGNLGIRGNVLRALDGIGHPFWLWDVMVRGRPHSFGNVVAAMPKHAKNVDYYAWVRNSFDPTVSWADLEWLRGRWPGQIVVKGILDTDDATDAVRAGVDGIVVSNHGGRQLDGAPPSLKVLPEILDAVDGRIPVLVDGGIRSGLDVLRCMAVGASGVMFGRAWAMALAAQGGQGVSRFLQTVRNEFANAMALTGCRSIVDIEPHLLSRVKE